MPRYIIEGKFSFEMIADTPQLAIDKARNWDIPNRVLGVSLAECAHDYTVSGKINNDTGEITELNIPFHANGERK